MKSIIQAYLDKLCQCFKELFVIDSELIVLIFDPIVFNFRLETDAEGVVAREVGRLPHKEESVLSWGQKLFSELT
jgi:hypothetical protein